MNSLIIFITGYVCSTPLDQSSIEVIRRSVMKDYRGAIFVGLGTALGDSVVFLTTLLGLSKVMHFINMHFLFGLICSVLLIFLGVTRIFPIFDNLSGKRIIVFSLNPILYGFIFSMFDPSSATGAILTLKLVGSLSFISVLTNAFLYFLGGLLWMFTLVSLFSLIKSFANTKILHILDRLSGVFFIGMGISFLNKLF